MLVVGMQADCQRCCAVTGSTADGHSPQVLLPGRGGHVHGGGPAARRGPALPPAAERAVHRGDGQAVPL